MATRPRRLICGCCGSGAYGRQWFNQDSGYGLCAACVYYLAERQPLEETQQSYGYLGKHYAAPLTVTCIPGSLVSWRTPDDELLSGTLKSWDHGVAAVDTEEGRRFVRAT